MNFVGNDILVLVASAASLPCNNNGALNSSLSHKALESTHTSTCCSRTSFQVHWVLLMNSWALLHFVFLFMLAVCYFLIEVKLKFIPCWTCESTVTELEMLVEKAQCTSLSWAFCFCQGGNFPEMLSVTYLVNWAFLKLLALRTPNSVLSLKKKNSLWLRASEPCTSDIET